MSYSYQVPLNYTIDVSVSATPSGLADFNVNSIAIFSNEPANFSEQYIRALSPDTIKNAFGSDSLTYKMARALFTPPMNFRTGGGELTVFKFGGVNATAGYLETSSLETKLENFKTVTDGALNISHDGVTTELTNLDFSTVKNVQDICTILLTKNPDLYITTENNKIKFASKRYGTNVYINTTETGTDISTSDYLAVSTATTYEGTSSSGQTLADAVEYGLQQVYFGGVLTTQYQDNATILSNAQAIEAQDVVYFNEISSLKNISVIGNQIKSAGCGKTRTLADSLGAEEAKIAIATYATISKSVNWSGSNTSMTMNLKTLTGCLPDTNLSDTYVLDAKENGVDIYGSTGGLSCVYSNDNNGYTDVIEFALAFKKRTEIAGFNYLRQTNTKIPQTQIALDGLNSAYAGVCERFITNGSIAPNTWNGAIPFGNPQAFADNIEQKGYYVYSELITKQSQTDREARKAPVAQIALKLSGAFHFAQIIVNFQN